MVFLNKGILLSKGFLSPFFLPFFLPPLPTETVGPSTSLQGKGSPSDSDYILPS